MSQKPTATFRVGIDLGTTHAVLAYSHRDTPNKTDIFDIPQLVGPGNLGKQPLLPCFRYHPKSHEIAPEDRQLPWEQTLQGDIPDVIIGSYAVTLGSKGSGPHGQQCQKLAVCKRCR